MYHRLQPDQNGDWWDRFLACTGAANLETASANGPQAPRSGFGATDVTLRRVRLTMESPKRPAVSMAAVLAVLGGVLLMGTAVVASNAGIERALLGNAARSLSWGPTLFRVLLGMHGGILLAWGVRVVVRPAGTHDGDPPATGQRTARVWWLLVALSTAALALRLWNLNSCLWFDEVLTLVDSVRAPLGQIVTQFSSQNQHMFFSVLARLSIEAFGEHAWSLRLPSVGFGIASLWALFLLGRRLFGESEALVACVLLTVSYHHVWFSQNARGYMALLFFATLATWLWQEALRRRGGSWYVAYALAVALGMWMHLTMVFVPVTHALLYAVQLSTHVWGKSGWTPARSLLAGAWRPLGALLLAASLTLQLYALSLPEFLQVGLHELSLESEWTNPLWVVTESLHGLRIGFGAVAVVLVGCGIAAVGWLNLVRRDWTAALSLVLPPVLGGALMLALGHNLWPRFFFFAMGFGVLIAVHGAMTGPQLLATHIRGGRRAGRRAGAVLAGLMIVASAVSLPRAYALPKQDFIGARNYVERVRRPNDGVVGVGLAGVAYQRYFAPHWQVAETAEQLEAIRRTHEQLWLVYTIPVQLKAYRPDVWDLVQRDFEVVETFPGTLGGGEVIVCTGRGEP